jgi:DNA-binding LacI/PurR family transcriptional regulator
MTTNRTTKRKTIGILTGYQIYEGNTISYYLLSVFRGILAAAESYDLHVLIACGMTAALQWGVPCPAWPMSSLETSFVPVGPWNTDGLIVIPPLRSQSRSHYIQELRADGFPAVYAGRWWLSST